MRTQNKLLVFFSVCFFSMIGLCSGTQAQRSLTRDETETLAKQYSDSILETSQPAAEKAWKERVILFDGLRTRLGIKVFGEKPADGRSLYISMHGGGGAPPEVNDQQWANQIMLYAPQEGVYVAPRAPTDTWDLWHQSHIDNIFDSLIRYAVLMEGVNPDKVYIMGYSAGGDGAYQIAPRMADRWAAASMMAGHPGDANALNLRNLPFSIFMGGRDDAYNRNGLAGEWKARLDTLQQADPGGYTHDVHIYPEFGHWMERRDSIAVPWMAGFRRNVTPDRVVWVQDDRVQNHFYWLQVPEGTAKQGDKVDVRVQVNTIDIVANTCAVLYINLNDQLIDLDKKVMVRMNGKALFKGKLKRRDVVLHQTAKEYKDARMVYAARLVIKEGRVTVF